MRQVDAACIGDGIRSPMPTTRIVAREAWLQKQNAPHQAESELNPHFWTREMGAVQRLMRGGRKGGFGLLGVCGL